MTKKILSLIVSVIFAISLAACSEPAFDASRYVKACLDAAYHEEYEDYANFINCTVDEAKADMEQQNLDAVEEEIASLEMMVSDEQKAEYLDLLMSIENMTKYEVGEATETENGFEVAVTVYPLDVYETFLSGIETAYHEAADAGELTDETIFPIMLKYLSECLNNAQFKEPVETTVNVTQDSEGLWQITDAEMFAIDDLVLPGI